MKKVTLHLALLLLAGGLFLATYIASCKKNDTTSTGVLSTNPCANCGNGTCVDDTCQCLYGYEGTHCATEIRAQYLGTYHCTKYCGSDSVTFTSTIDSVPGNILEVVINNFGGFSPSINVVAEINPNGDTWNVLPISNGSINIITGGDPLYLSPSVLYINFVYTLGNSSTQLNCYITFRR